MMVLSMYKYVRETTRNCCEDGFGTDKADRATLFFYPALLFCHSEAQLKLSF